MTENENKDQKEPDQNGQKNAQPLADELGIENIYDPMFGAHGKVFCTAGRDAPIAEFTDDCLIMHPPQMPLDESGKGEAISLKIDARGILLDEFGAPKKIPAATFKGCPIYFSGEHAPGTLKNYAVVLSHDGSLQAIIHEKGHRLTTQEVYNLRNRSPEGDLSIFKNLSCNV